MSARPSYPKPNALLHHAERSAYLAMQGDTALVRKIHNKAGLIQELFGAPDRLAAVSAHYARGDDSEEFASTLMDAADRAHPGEWDLFATRAVMQVRLLSGAAVATYWYPHKYGQQAALKQNCACQLRGPLQACTGICLLVHSLHQARQSSENQGGCKGGYVVFQ